MIVLLGKFDGVTASTARKTLIRVSLRVHTHRRVSVMVKRAYGQIDFALSHQIVPTEVVGDNIDDVALPTHLTKDVVVIVIELSHFILNVRNVS